MDQRSVMDGTAGNLLSNAFQKYLEWREEAGRQFGATLEAASNGDEVAALDLAMRFLPGGGIRSIGGRNFVARAFPRARAFDKAGIETTEHFRKNLAQRGSRLTEENALDAYRNGRLYYDPAHGNYVRHSSRTGVSVVVEGSPTGGRAHSVFEGDPLSRWIPVRWRLGQ